ncbi:MAG TPA: hypothetical protein VFW75_05830, partial [Acetobacteraceae bacterium]|nr:hypothetical protein [Acetobacteraceae bacterium]
MEIGQLAVDHQSRRAGRRFRLVSPVALVPVSWRLSWRNLVHDRARLVVTLTGISFSVVLMAIQVGLLLGCIETSSGLVQHAGVDFWITSHRTINVDQSVAIPDRLRLRALAVP